MSVAQASDIFLPDRTARSWSLHNSSIVRSPAVPLKERPTTRGDLPFSPPLWQLCESSACCAAAPKEIPP